MRWFDTSLPGIVDSLQAGKRRFVALYLFFRDTVADWLAALAAIAFALPQVQSGSRRWATFWISLGVLLLVLSVVNTVVRSRRVSVLVNELSRAKQAAERAATSEKRERRAFRAAMSQMSHRLCRSLSLWTPTTRLTIYGWAHNSFIPLVRVSSNPRFSRVNRSSYPDSQGILSEIWTKNTEYQQYWKKPKAARRDALKSGMTDEVYDALILKPLCAIGLRVDVDERKLGIILIESEKRDELGPAHYDALIDSEIFADLKAMMIAAQDLFESDVLESESARSWSNDCTGDVEF